MTIPTGTETARPFLPAKDFAASKAFYEQLGFRKIQDGQVAVFEIGPTSFILQNFFKQDMAAGLMMALVVDDLDAWWQHIQSLDLPGKFGCASPKAPEMQPWGMRVAYVADPSGVLWHIQQRPITH